MSTGAESVPDKRPTTGLSTVRQFEAAGLRAWPAAAVHYDGTWVVRLTAGHPAKRLNSVNPLDPRDVHDLPERVMRAGRRFEAYGRPLTFRISPLAGAPLERYLEAEGWAAFGESLVMQADLDNEAVHGAMDQIPLQDMGRFVTASMKTHATDAALRAGLSEIIGAIQPEAGLFALEHDDEPLATAICVHEGDLAGLFEVATAQAVRGQGYGRRLVLSALKWARLRGARRAWLQVEADNRAARRLYETLGFSELYRYHYRRVPED
jgi:ribosomal protein S18 acetylase RimI-like enzyme